jgi:hypothetical protein
LGQTANWYRNEKAAGTFLVFLQICGWGEGGGEVSFVFAIKEKLVYPNRRKRRKVRGNVKFLLSTKQHKMSPVIIIVNFTFRY